MTGITYSLRRILKKPHMPWQGLSADNDRYALHRDHGRNVAPHLVFALTIAATLVLGWALYDSSSKAHESSARVRHSHEVLAEIASLESNLARADLSLRGYILSRNSGFVIERDGALSMADDDAVRLIGYVSDNPQQHARATLLRELVTERIRAMKDTVVNDHIGDTSRFSTIRAASRASESIHALTRELRDTEDRLLDIRRGEEDLRHGRTMSLLLAASLLALLIVVPGYVVYMMQIRARARIERKLLDMADGVPGVVYQYRSRSDGSSQYEFLSGGVRKLYGIGRDDALHDAGLIVNTIVEEDRAALSAEIARAAEADVSLQYDFRVDAGDGVVKWVRSSAAPHREADGSIVWNGHWADVSRQKRLESELQAAKDAADSASLAKSSFLAVMSHEIRTPMNGVLGMLELLSLTELDPNQRATLQIVRESGKALQLIIDEILDFSKIEAGKLHVDPQPTSIRQLVFAARSAYDGNASSKGLLLQCSVDSRISPALVVDPLRLRQVLNNLISNAIKFTPAGNVRVEARQLALTADTETVALAVTDDGIGMAPEAQMRLFQPFMQSGSNTAHRFGGTGLGLSISRRLVDLMGGSIEVESELGKGTTMRVILELPIADPADLARSEADAPGAAPSAIVATRPVPTVAQAEREGTLILVVDDHSVNRSVLLRQVNVLGYAAECAENGLEGLDLWKTGRFGAVITDCNMPEMDGYALTREIRRLEAASGQKRSPVIACTANALRGEAETCLEAGMDDYLPKPVQLVALQVTLRRWLPLPMAAADSVTDAATDTDRGAAFDRGALAALVGDSAQAAVEILAEFQRAADEDAAALAAAARSKDLLRVERAAHRMKGASRVVGMNGLATACEVLEQAAHAQEIARVDQALTRVQDQYALTSRLIGSMSSTASML
jgi:signal transduction histidine kinase/CheY-like chemotaxis protein